MTDYTIQTQPDDATVDPLEAYSPHTVDCVILAREAARAIHRRDLRSLEITKIYNDTTITVKASR